MNKVIPNSTEVLIFKYIREWGLNQNEKYLNQISLLNNNNVKQLKK